MTDAGNIQIQNISRRELRALVRSQLQMLMEQGNLQGAKALLVPVQPADIAEAIEGLPEAMQALVFRLLSKDEAIEVYECLSSTVQQILIEDFKRQDVIDIVDQMSPDDRARLFDELPAKVVTRLLDQLSLPERQSTALLLGYESGTAGRIMTPEYVSLKESLTVFEALERIRSLEKFTETIYYLYVIDSARHLTGIISLRELVVSQPTDQIGDKMEREVVYVETNTDQEEVASLIQDYDYLAMPVVDREQRLVGIVTVDDILDVVEEETTEDIYKMGGVQASTDDYFQSSLLTVGRRRILWLLVLFVTNTGTAAIISSQKDVLDPILYASLIPFIQLLTGTGGNVGAQSSTVVIRRLNVESADLNRPWWVIQREALAGAGLGLTLGFIAVIWAILLLKTSWFVAIAVGFSLLVISTLASVAGSALPYLFKSLKLDPALMSAPFITTAVDVLGVMIYFAIAGFIFEKF